MDALTYLRKRTLMLNSIGRIDSHCDGANCLKCPFAKEIEDEPDIYCDQLEADYPELAISIVEKWAETHI